jgi:hypothetical protein
MYIFSDAESVPERRPGRVQPGADAAAKRWQVDLDHPL